MTLIKVVLLAIGMGAVGVPVVLGVFVPVVGAVVTRVLPERAWNGVMLVFTQVFAALVTFAIGTVIGLPWYAALIAALVVGITSYASRGSEPLPTYADDAAYPASNYGGPDIFMLDGRLEDPRPRPELTAADRDRAQLSCPECGKVCIGHRGLSMHQRDKHHTS